MDSSDSQDGDVSKQLHSSVRTANLETSLRLLSCGADPNYLHQVIILSNPLDDIPFKKKTDFHRKKEHVPCM